MHAIFRRVPVAALILAVALLCGASRASEADDEWHFSIVPYLWLPSVNTQSSLNGLPGEIETDTGADEIFGDLDFALLLSGEVRKGKLGLIYDFQYLKLSDDGTTSGPAPRDFEADVTFGDFTLAPEYRFVESPKFSLDGFVGIRVLYADVGVDVDPGVVLPGFSRGDSETWVDPIVGAKAVYHLNERWALLGYGDIGGFGVGSEFSYQLLGTVSYRLNQHFAIHGGYCLFSTDYERDDFKFEATMHGPVIGFAFSL